jgi:hypothetical protein
MSIADKFNIPPALFETIKKMNAEETEYQAKVKALMAKRGIKSLGDLSPEEKKDFFNTLDSMHKAKNEEVDLDEAKKPVSKEDVTKLLVKYGNNPQSAKKMVDKEFASAVKRHPEATASKIAEVIRSVAEEVEINEMDKSQPSSSRGAEGVPTGKKANPIKTDKLKQDALKTLYKSYKDKKVREDVELEEGKSGTGYELYHKDFSSAMAHAYDFAKKKYNIEVDPQEIDRNVAMGPKKPSSGKANAYRLLDKTGKKAIQVQVTNLDNKRYELNMYKEEVEQVDELKVSTLTRYGTKATQAYGRNPEKDEKRQQGIQRARAKVQQKTMKKEEIELTESHFKVGQRVECIKSGMKGTVVKVDKPEVGKYYTVRQDSGKMMKYAPDELKALSTNEAKDGGASKKKEAEFHKKLDTLVHKTFGKRPEEMKEEVEELDEGMSAAQISKLRDAYASIDKIDVSGQPYKQLVAFLDKQDLKTLKMLAGAKIKFISGMAQNRVVRKMNESIGSTLGGALGQYAGAKMGLEGPGRAHGENLGRALEYYARLILKKLTKEEIELDEEETKEFMVKFEKQGKVSVKNYTGKSDLDVRSKAKVDAKRMGMTVASVRLKEEVEEAVDPQKSMKRAGLSVARAKEVMRHRKEIGTIRKKREALRNSFDPTATVLEAYKKGKMKKEATAKDKSKSVNPGDKLSGKSEPIEINPELKEQKT